MALSLVDRAINGALSLSERTATEFGVSVPAQSWSEIRVLGRIGLQYSW